MKLHVLPTLALLAGIALAACALTAAQKAALTAEAVQAGETSAACVASQAVGGQTSASVIAVTCGIADIPTVLQIVQTLLGSLAAPSDAGALAFSPGSTRAQMIAALKAVR